VHQALQAQLVNQDQQELRVRLGLLDHRVTQVLQDLSVTPAILDRLVRLEMPDQMAILESVEHLEHREGPVRLEQPVPLDQQDLSGSLEQLAETELLVSPVL